MIKFVPSLLFDSNVISALNELRIFLTIPNPKPMPPDFVVNLGSKILFLSPILIPEPLSDIITFT